MEKDTFKRRCDHDVIANILAISVEGATRTEIMYGANLSFTLLDRYLTVLVKNGLLDKLEGKRQTLYVTSEKGRNFLSKYHEIQALYPIKIKKGKF